MFSRSPFFQKTIEITLENFFPNFSPVSAFSFSSAKWNWTAAAAAAASRMETGGYLMELLFLDINSIAAVACFSCLHSSSIPSLLAPLRSEIWLNRNKQDVNLVSFNIAVFPLFPSMEWHPFHHRWCVWSVIRLGRTWIGLETWGCLIETNNA